MTASLKANRALFVASESERKTLNVLERALHRSRRRKAQLVGPDGRPTILPRSLYDVLREAVRQLATGNAVSIRPVTAELTTQQAAEELYVSRPFLIKLLERGEIPFHMAGTHRRIYLRDLIAFKERRDAAGRNAIDELARSAQDLGVYDE